MGNNEKKIIKLHNDLQKAWQKCFARMKREKSGGQIVVKKDGKLIATIGLGTAEDERTNEFHYERYNHEEFGEYYVLLKVASKDKGYSIDPYEYIKIFSDDSGNRAAPGCYCGDTEFFDENEKVALGYLNEILSIIGIPQLSVGEIKAKKASKKIDNQCK